VTDSSPARPSVVQSSGGGVGSSPEPANLGDILERVLDKGLVIVGDIRVNLLDIELLTIKLRLLIASVDTARQLGIDWWEHDPWLTSDSNKLLKENRRLQRELAASGADHEGRELASAEADDGGRGSRGSARGTLADHSAETEDRGG